MNIGLDIGQNLTLLGILFLSLKFLLPFIFGVIILLILAGTVIYTLRRLDIDIDFAEIIITPYFLAFGIIVLLLILTAS